VAVTGDAGAVLRKAKSVRTKWLVDAADDLEPANGSAEMFTDRRLEEADLVVTGWRFVTVTPALAAWAKKLGCTGVRWQAGAALKIPKLEAPLTLWRTEFARRVITEREDMEPAVVIAAWAATAKATVMEAKIKPQGWKLTGPAKL
jgi:hypothetical protein